MLSWAKILLFTFLFLWVSSLNAQAVTFGYESIKDTAQLTKVIELTISEVKETNSLNKEKVYALLQTSLELRDTASFYDLCKNAEKNYYRNNSIDQEAILFLKECQKIMGNSSSSIGDINNNIGNYYRRLNFSYEAIDYYFKSLEWFRKYNELGSTIPLGNLSEIYFINENYEKALEYNELALSYSLKMTDRKDQLYNILYDCSRLGAIYHELNDNLKASDLFERSLSAARELGDDEMMLVTINKCLPFYSSVSKNNYSTQLIAEGDAIAKKLGDGHSNLIEDFLLKKNSHYLKIGDIVKALSPEDLQIQSKVLKTNKLLYSAEYYAFIKDVDNTGRFYKELLDEETRIHRESRIGVISNIEEKYLNKELLVKNKELSSSIITRKKTNYTILAILGLISSLLILQLLNNRRYKKLNYLLKSKSEELGHMNDNLKKSNEELERFAYITSHDLKTPLRDIVSFTGLLERHLESDENPKVHNYLSFIKKGGLRLNSLITSTLEYSRLSYSDELVEQETIDLNTLLNELESSMSVYVKERNARLLLSSNLPSLSGNKQSVFLLFQNLIENGIKYNKSDAPIIKVYAKENPNSVSIFIEDNGIGIGQEYLDKVFIMFSRLHNQNEYSGSGLGLSICKKIVEQLNGQIFIKSEVNKGSLFEVKLPNDLIVSPLGQSLKDASSQIM